MALPTMLPIEKRQFHVSDGVTSGTGRFKFACFVKSFDSPEQRALITHKLRDCADADAPPADSHLPGSYSATKTLTGVAVPSNAQYQAMKDAVRSGARMEFMDKIDLAAEAGGGADTFWGYVTSFNEGTPEEGAVTFTATVTIDGVPSWAPAA